jgi:hypothetical protein
MLVGGFVGPAFVEDVIGAEADRIWTRPFQTLR